MSAPRVPTDSAVRDEAPLATPSVELSRPEMITAGLILLLSAYRCRACPYLAGCIVNHCRSLRTHPDADLVLRQLAAHLEIEWCPLALPSTAGKQTH